MLVLFNFVYIVFLRNEVHKSDLYYIMYWNAYKYIIQITNIIQIYQGGVDIPNLLLHNMDWEYLLPMDKF